MHIDIRKCYIILDHCLLHMYMYCINISWQHYTNVHVHVTTDHTIKLSYFFDVSSFTVIKSIQSNMTTKKWTLLVDHLKKKDNKF